MSRTTRSSRSSGIGSVWGCCSWRCSRRARWRPPEPGRPRRRLAAVATVILLRHGRTTSNADGTLAGSRPVGLDEAGIVQAKAAGERLAGVPLAAVVTSPLPRCRETVALALPDAQPAVDPRLAEAGYGAWEGQPLKKLA